MKSPSYLRGSGRRTAAQSLARYRDNKLRFNISRRISLSLTGRRKGASWQELVGYSLADLRRHLEALFQPGMTWNNYGDWEIDHRRPVASFSFTTPHCLGFRDCWALSNLQPLWAQENRSKGARI